VSRVSPELAEARRQVDVLLRQIRAYREEWVLADVPCCGDHSCVCRPPQGMATNGGCRCSQRDLMRAVLWYRHEYARLIAEKAEVAP